MIRDIVTQGFSKSGVSDSLRDLYTATRDVLIPNLTTEEFAGMFAQTLAYGLFAARVNHEAGDIWQAERGNPHSAHQPVCQADIRHDWRCDTRR